MSSETHPGTNQTMFFVLSLEQNRKIPEIRFCIEPRAAFWPTQIIGVHADI